MSDNDLKSYFNNKLIITIVKKGAASKVISETRKAGVKGGTILLGRGTKVKNKYIQLLGVDYDPEKEIVLTLVSSEMADSILELIEQTALLKKPGNGIAFVLDVKNVLGIAHLFSPPHTTD